MEDGKFRKWKIQRGQVIVELLIAFGLTALLIPALLVGLIAGRNGKAQQQQRVIALGLLKEGEEAVRSVREADWANITSPAVTMTTNPLAPHFYHPVAGTSWSLGGGAEPIGDYTRTIIFTDLTPVDPSLKKVTVTVTWGTFFSSKVTSTFMLARWKNLTSDLTVSGTLLNEGNGDWCNPSSPIASIDLGNATAQSISAIQGQVTTGTGQAAAGFTFVNALLNDPQSPATPSATAINTFNGPTKTNDVFTLQDYALIATDSHTKDIDIINLGSVTGGKYSEGGFFDSPSNGSANAATVVASGNAGYMTIGNMLYDFSLSGLPNTSVSRPAIHTSGLQLPAPATKMVIHNNRLYISTTSITYQMVVVDASTLTYIDKPTATPGKVHVDGMGGKSLYVNATGTRVYLVTEYSTDPNKKDMFIINVDETSAEFGSTKGSYNTNGMNPTGIVQVNISNYVIIVGTGGTLQYQVVDVTDDSPSLCTRGGTTSGGLSVPEGINGIATVFTTAQRAYSYIITNTNNYQLKIIEGGPGGGGSGGGLVLESDVLDAGHTSTFNRISIINLTPPTITVSYQVAVSTNCLTYNYTGNYTSAGGPIPLSINPGQCFKYKATFSGGTGGTNVSTTVRVNYSP